MAVQLPALKKIGEELGVSMDNGVAGLTEGLLDEPVKDEAPAIDDGSDDNSSDTPKPVPVE